MMMNREGLGELEPHPGNCVKKTTKKKALKKA
jgi:hypothetical protein